MAFKETYNIDAAQAERALKNLAEANKRVGDGTAAVVKGLTAEDKAARRIAEAADPMKKFNRQHEELAVLVNKGKVSLEEAAVVAQKYQQRLDGAGKAGEASFGSKAISNLATVATRWVGIGAAVSAVTEAVRQYAAETQKGMDLAKGTKSIGSLAQLAVTMGDNPSDRSAAQSRLEDEALRYFAMGAAASPDEGGNLAFALNSAGLNDRDRGFMARAKASNLINDPERFASAVAAFQSSYDMSLEDITSKGLAVSRVAPAQANEIVAEVAKIGAGLRAASLGADEGLAAEAILAKTFGSASEGGTRLKGFVGALEKKAFEAMPSLRGQSMSSILAAMDELGVDTDRNVAKRFLGDSDEAIAGARVLMSNRGLLDQLARESSVADDNRLAFEAIELARQNPVFGAGQALLSSENKRGLERMLDSQLPNLVQASRNELVTYRRNNYNPVVAEVLNALEGANIAGYSWTGQTRQTDLLNEAKGTGALSPELVDRIDRALLLLDRVANASEGTRNELPMVKPSAE